MSFAISVFCHLRGNQEEVKTTSSDKNKQKELSRQKEQERREQKEILERENKYRKKFKVICHISMR